MTTEENSFDSFYDKNQDRKKEDERSPWITLVVLVFLSKIMAGGFLSALFGGIAIYYFFDTIFPDLQQKYQEKKQRPQNSNAQPSNQREEDYFEEEDFLDPLEDDYLDLEQNLGPDSLDELIEEKHKKHHYRY